MTFQNKASIPVILSANLPPCGRTLPKNSASKKQSDELLRAMMEKLDRHVSDQNLNRSNARKKILEVIVREVRHFRAQDLVDRLGAEKVGRSTIYRNLPILVECGLLQEGPTDSDGQIRYELSSGDHHDHIVCVDCHAIIEFHDELIEEKQREVTQALGFTAQDHQHVLYASCDLLRKKKSTSG